MKRQITVFSDIEDDKYSCVVVGSRVANDASYRIKWDSKSDDVGVILVRKLLPGDTLEDPKYVEHSIDGNEFVSVFNLTLGAAKNLQAALTEYLQGL